MFSRRRYFDDEEEEENEEIKKMMIPKIPEFEAHSPPLAPPPSEVHVRPVYASQLSTESPYDLTTSARTPEVPDIAVPDSPPTPAPIPQEKKKGLGPKKQSSVFDLPTFDQLFQSQGHVKFDLIQSKSYSADKSDDISQDTGQGQKPDLELGGERSPQEVARVDSIMKLSFSDVVIKNWQKSMGFMGFRRRMASDISHKYCSYCRCDENLFMFLQVLFGIIEISAGVLCLLHCWAEGMVYIFLLTDGLLNVFVFPISVMNWTKWVGGCVPDNQKLGTGACFATVIIIRVLSAAAGTAIIVLREESLLTADTLMCQIIFAIFYTAVYAGWIFLIIIILCPFLFYLGLYAVVNITRSKE